MSPAVKQEGCLVIVPHPATEGPLVGKWLCLWVVRADRDAPRTRVLAGAPCLFEDRSDAFQHAINQAHLLNGDPRRTRKGMRYADLEGIGDFFVLPRGEQWACDGMAGPGLAARALERAAENLRLFGRL